METIDVVTAFALVGLCITLAAVALIAVRNAREADALLEEYIEQHSKRYIKDNVALKVTTDETKYSRNSSSEEN